MPTPPLMHSGCPSATPTPHEVRRIAVEAGTDPRTVAKYLAGGRVVSTCADRIRRALDAADPSGARRGLRIVKDNASGR
jgi:hypothetical protein